MMDLSFMIIVSIALFVIGVIGILTKRNVLILFLSIELKLNGVNLLFVSFSRMWENEIGLCWVFFVLLLAAVEAAIGFAIIINLYRSTNHVDVDQYNRLKG